jgi:hypothetical protein
VKLSSWPEIGLDGDVLLTPYVSKGIAGYDDDDVIATKCPITENLPIHQKLGTSDNGQCPK